MYNATDDLTDQDKVAFQYRNLMKNKFKTETEIEQEIAKEKDFRKSWKYAVMDMAIGILIMIIYAFIMCLPVLLTRP
jgi:hypothetical protein